MFEVIFGHFVFGNGIVLCGGPEHMLSRSYKGTSHHQLIDVKQTTQTQKHKHTLRIYTYIYIYIIVMSFEQIHEWCRWSRYDARAFERDCWQIPACISFLPGADAKPADVKARMITKQSQVNVAPVAEVVVDQAKKQLFGYGCRPNMNEPLAYLCERTRSFNW